MATYNGNGSGDIQESSEPVDKRKVFVGSLSTETDEEDLKTYFAQYGTVVHCVVKRDPASGRSRGFAFVTFTDSSAVKAVNAVSNHMLKGKRIDPKIAEPRPGEEAILKVFVGGIDTTMADEDLKTYFEKFGPVKNIEWPKDRLRDNAKKNFAFIEYEDERIVNEIIRTPKQTIGGRLCDVKKALPTQPKPPGGGGGGYGNYGSPYGSGGFGGGYGGRGGYGGGGYGGGGGGYGDQYASYYGSQGYDGGYYADPNAGYYGGYDYGAGGGYDYGGGYGGYGDANGAGGYGAPRGGMRGGMRGRGAGGMSPRGAAKAGGIAGAGSRGGARGYHPYRR